MRQPSLRSIGLALTVLATAIGHAQQTGAPSGRAPGVLIDIGGYKLHLRCVGPATARPTVILGAGGGDSSNRWSFVQDLLSPRIRTCAYDRAGSGWSEAGPAPRTMRQEVFELHLLLDAARVPPPYVLVGHSLGGLLVRRYTEQHGPDVIGVVLSEEKNDLARLSRNSKLVRDPSSGHRIHVDNPRLVASAIEEVIDAALKRTRLLP